jgi:hypothetical protein
MRDEIAEAKAPKPDLKPANENPWYVLMTLDGEQEGDEIDEELQKRNAKLWNMHSQVVPGTSAVERTREHSLTFEAQRHPGVTTRDVEDRFQRQWKLRHGDEAPVPPLPGRYDPVDLGGTDFSKLFSANNMFLCSDLHLKGSRFQKDALFIKCGFEKTVDLSGAEVTGSAHFTDSCFVSDFSAEGLKVGGRLVLNDVAVDGDLYLKQVRVGGTAMLLKMKVTNSAIFDSCRFKGACCFEGSEFANRVSFQDTSFFGDAAFRSVTFGKYASFVFSKFGKNVSFASSIFDTDVDFRNSTFCKNASFVKVQFKGITDFTESKFYTSGTDGMAGIRYTDAIFGKSTSFGGALFPHSYPEFTNTDLYPVTDFTADAALWPSGLTTPAKEARESCGIIRNLLAKKGLTEDQHFFFRREMYFASHHEEPLRRFPYQVYRYLSDYGHSIARPLIGLAIVWAFGFACFWGYLAGCCVPSPSEVTDHPMGAALALSFSNLFPLFGFGRTFLRGVLQDLPTSLAVLSGFQTFISLPLLFFLGLGLRQRFRLR